MSLHKPIAPPTNSSVVDQQSPDRPGLRRRLRRWLWRSILVIVVAAIVIPALMYVTTPRYYTVLLIGSDQRAHEHARSDVLLLVTIPKSAGDQVSLTMIPRDTKIDDADRGIQKITHYYAMWEDPNETLGNRTLTTKQVEQVLGITVNATIEVTFESFVEIIDMVGGVDTSQGHLDGAAAEELVHNRFNKPNGDFGRGQVERDIVKQVLADVTNPWHARQLYNYFQTSQRARLTYNQGSLIHFAAAYLIGHHGNLALPTGQELVLPGHGEKIYTPAFGKDLYYWVLDKAGTESLVSESLR